MTLNDTTRGDAFCLASSKSFGGLSIDTDEQVISTNARLTLMMNLFLNEIYNSSNTFNSLIPVSIKLVERIAMISERPWLHSPNVLQCRQKCENFNLFSMDNLAWRVELANKCKWFWNTYMYIAAGASSIQHSYLCTFNGRRPWMADTLYFEESKLKSNEKKSAIFFNSFMIHPKVISDYFFSWVISVSNMYFLFCFA